MKRLSVILSLCISGLMAHAQSPDTVVYKDTVILVTIPQVNTGLSEADVFETMPGNVHINDSGAIRAASIQLINQNRQSKEDIEGYRIRIYLDNRQDAREKSEEAERRFQSLFPGYGTYRSFNYPNFKVTVGDFRTKADAQKLLAKVLRYFPSAFVVKEKTGFPLISETVRYRMDTIQIPVPVKEETANE